MFEDYDPNAIEDEAKVDELFIKADTWLEQCEFIGSLMDLPDYPEHWEDFVTEPDEEFMRLSDQSAAELEAELKPSQ